MEMKIKSIRDTYLYTSTNKDGFMDKSIKAAISKGKQLTYNDLSYEVNTINKYYKYPMKKNVMDAYMNGILKPIVFPQGSVEKLSASVPFMLGQQDGKMIAYVMIDNYKTYVKQSDTYSIDPKKLYTLLESAYIAIIINKMYPVFSRNKTACAEGATIFANLFIRVLNRKYALNVDKRAYTKVMYLTAKFFMVNQLGCPANVETTTNYAMSVADCESPFLVNEVDQLFDPGCYANLSTFITALQKNAYAISQGLSALTIKDYIIDYVNMYHTSSIYALEHFAYFMFMIDSVIVGAYLNNQVLLEDIVDKSGAKLYTLIANYEI